MSLLCHVVLLFPSVEDKIPSMLAAYPKAHVGTVCALL